MAGTDTKEKQMRGGISPCKLYNSKLEENYLPLKSQAVQKLSSAPPTTRASHSVEEFPDSKSTHPNNKSFRVICWEIERVHILPICTRVS